MEDGTFDIVCSSDFRYQYLTIFFLLKVMKTHPRVLFCYLNKMGMQKISLSHSLLFKLTQL